MAKRTDWDRWIESHREARLCGEKVKTEDFRGSIGRDVGLGADSYLVTFCAPKGQGGAEVKCFGFSSPEQARAFLSDLHTWLAYLFAEREEGEAEERDALLERAEQEGR